jgi:hypothetical protein
MTVNILVIFPDALCVQKDKLQDLPCVYSQAYYTFIPQYKFIFKICKYETIGMGQP